MHSILHICSLQRVGGSETTLCDFLESPFMKKKANNYIYALGNKAHHDLQSRINKISIPIYFARSTLGLNNPISLSKIKFQCLIKILSPKLIIFWNCLGSINNKNKWLYNLDIPYIHFERGNIESCTFEHHKLEYLKSAQLIITNSFSNSRHISLRYNLTRDIYVSYTGLPRSFENIGGGYKNFPLDRNLRVAVCGRLNSIKGIAIALQSLRLLKDKAIIFDLHIAGTGPEAEKIQSLASKLDVADQVFFHGFISSTAIINFYEMVDLLIIPAIREPFAKVSLEAQYKGCPAIVSRVDGVPETILEGVTGYSIPPTLDIEEYIQMGGSSDGLPELVYNPDEDSLEPPKALNPEHLAEKLRFILQNPDLYEKLSQNAYNTAKERFSHEKHIKEIWKLFEEAMGNSRHHP